MLTIAKAGIKSATVADMGGIARTAELLSEIPEEMIDDHGAADALTVHAMAKTVARLILDCNAKGEWQTANAMLAAMPQTVAEAEVWRAWAGDIVAANETGDPDRIVATYDRRPWREEAA